MKLAGLILSFYLILLAAVPCCVFDNCQVDKMGQVANHEKEDSDCGNCSPFFSCEGCAAASIVFDPNIPENVPANAPHIFPDYIQSSLPGVAFDFWQPPKFS
jgi:hypothetical protein